MIRRAARRFPAVIVAVLVSLWPVCDALAAAQGPAAPQSAPASPAASPIPVPEIATRAAELSNTLQTLQGKLAQSPAIRDIEAKLPEVRGDIERELPATTAILRSPATLEAIQASQKSWEERERQLTRWLKILTARTVQLREALNQIHQQRTIWTATRETAQASNSPALVLQQVDAAIASLDAAKPPLEAVHGSVLDLQTAVAGEVARCESVLDEVARVQEKAVGSLLIPDAPPIWSPALWSEAGKSLPDSLTRALASSWEEVRQFLRSHYRLVLLVGVLFLATGWGFERIGSDLRRRDGMEASLLSPMRVFEDPWSAAYIVLLLFVTGPLSPSPLLVQRAFSLVGFLPMIRLIAPLGPEIVRLGTIAGVLFALEFIRKLLAGVPLVEQAFLMLEVLSTAAILAWAHARGHLEPLLKSAERSARERWTRPLGVLIPVGLALGLIAASVGCLRLARLLASSALGIGFLVLLLHACLQILIGLVGFALSVWPFRCLHMVEHHCDLLVHRAQRLLVFMAIAVGVSRSLEHMGLLQPTLAFAEAVLTTKIERGALSLSLGDVLLFFLTVWAAYLLSAFLRFALGEDVYPRLQVPTGLSYAVSSLLNYVILALGVVAGMAVVGVNLTRVTVMAGALGVGIGFGLQSVVNNFVSGLILLFERPIHVGDNIAVGDLTGEVKRIGIRASTIRTRQGAEIIVPNAQLVTDKVTNWTLSDQLRRIDIPVGVNYGADAKDVIAVLVQVARNHPHVLKTPPPYCLFTGLGDSTINFELRAWTDAYTDWNHIRSDLTAAIYEAIPEAGMSFPFPQREVRLIGRPGSDDPPDDPAPPTDQRG